MLTRPRVTVGLPVYNAERYLAGAIEAHLNQTHESSELIVCDNGSTHRTAEICGYYARLDPGIMYHRNGINIGVNSYHAEVNQLSRREAEFFRWAAADDLTDPDRQRRQQAKEASRIRDMNSIRAWIDPKLRFKVPLPQVGSKTWWSRNAFFADLAGVFNAELGRADDVPF